MRKKTIINPKELGSISYSKTQFKISDIEILDWGKPDFKLKNLFFWGTEYNLIRIYDLSERVIGFVLGTLIDYKNKLVIQDNIHLSMILSKQNEDKFEQFLFSFGGSWTAIVSYLDIKRIYVDANSTLGIVYDDKTHKIGSTTLSILQNGEYVSRFQSKLYFDLDVLNNGWFPGSLTAHQGIYRLLPNHYLDLITWHQVRHWPTAETLNQKTMLVPDLHSIQKIVTDQIETLTNSGKVCCSLTAGHETRFLLACSKKYWHKIDFVTITSKMAMLDVYCSKKLTTLFNLNHKLLPVRKATNIQRNQWIYNTGHCVGGSNSCTYPSLSPLKKYDFFIGGLGGEVGRGFLFHKKDSQEKNLSAKEIIARFGLPLNAIIIEAIQKWLEKLPEMSFFQVLDLAYIELRMGPWGFGSAYTNHPVNEIHPLICREVYELFFRLSPSIKKMNPFLTIINQINKDLLIYPINKYGNFRDILFILFKIIHIKLVISKIRKLVPARDLFTKKNHCK